MSAVTEILKILLIIRYPEITIMNSKNIIIATLVGSIEDVEYAQLTPSFTSFPNQVWFLNHPSFR